MVVGPLGLVSLPYFPEIVEGTLPLDHAPLSARADHDGDEARYEVIKPAYQLPPPPNVVETRKPCTKPSTARGSHALRRIC
jgi:hypothetical protein